MTGVRSELVPKSGAGGEAMGDEQRSEPAAEQPADAALARALKRLRRRTRLSQRTLAKQSGIAFTTIQGIEDERRAYTRPVKPNPATLRLLARGIATDPERRDRVDEGKANAAYEALMRAAGYLDGIKLASGAGAGTTAALLALFDPDDLIAIERVLPVLETDDIEFLRRSIAAFARDVAAKRRAADPGGDPSDNPGDDPSRDPGDDPSRDRTASGVDTRLQHTGEPLVH